MSQASPRVSLIGKTAQACEYVSLACLAVIATLIFVQILLRNFASLAYAGIEEVARFAHINLVFLLVPLLFREGLLPGKNDLPLLLINVFETKMNGAASLCPPYRCRFDFLGWKAQHGSRR